MWNWKLVLPIPIYFHLTGTMITNHQIWGSIWSYVYVQIDPFSYILTFLLSWYIAQPQYAPYIYTYGIDIILNKPKAWPTWFKCMYIQHAGIIIIDVCPISSMYTGFPTARFDYRRVSAIDWCIQVLPPEWNLITGCWCWTHPRNILISCNHHLV